MRGNTRPGGSVGGVSLWHPGLAAKADWDTFPLEYKTICEHTTNPGGNFLA